jgi:hypothetical protein
VERPTFDDMNGVAARQLAGVLLPAMSRGGQVGESTQHIAKVPKITCSNAGESAQNSAKEPKMYGGGGGDGGVGGGVGNIPGSRGRTSGGGAVGLCTLNQFDP